jgi:hypothetical protein
MAEKPKKIKISPATGKKVRATGSNPPQGQELSGLLGLIVKKLKGS